MPFEIYRPRAQKEKVVTLTKNHIRIGAKLKEKLNSNYAELAFDRETSTIRIRPASAEDGLIINKNRIGARGFFQHFDINIRGKFEAKFDESDRSIYVNLNKPL